jgi:membrane protease YdiL (CAAX protease family)
MEPEDQPNVPSTQLDATQSALPVTEEAAADDALAAFPTLTEAAMPPTPQGPPEPGSLPWFFMGANGLRAGWSIAIFIPIMLIVSSIVAATLYFAHLIGLHSDHVSPRGTFFDKLILLAGLAGAAAIVALIEGRKRNLLEYNLIGPNRVRHFVVGTLAGFAALSALVGTLKAGGWLTIASSGLATPQLLKYALVWGATMLIVGFHEEGLFRCYLQATWTRGINLWWALGIEAILCGCLLVFTKGNGVWGVYLLVLLGLAPCLWLALQKAESAGFWLAAWVTSTLFGAIHTGNNGENWIGIFAAAAIGFVFVASVRLTGSAWWAIGFHAAWDWAETYFFGTADSGMQAQGSFMISKPTGNTFWSGGADGPEGSVLVLAIILLTLLGMVLAYGWQRTAPEQQATA